LLLIDWRRDVPFSWLPMRFRSLSLLWWEILGRVPVKPFPARYKVVRLDSANKHEGIDPWNGRLLLPHVDPTPPPSMIRLDTFELQTIEGSVPVRQFKDSTRVFRIGKLNNDEDIDPVRLIEYRIMYCKLLVVLALNMDTKLPPRWILLDRSMLIRLDSASMLEGTVPIRLLVCK